MDQNFYMRLMGRINNPELFAAKSGIQVTSCGEGYAEGVLTVSPSSMNPRGIVHGGCLSTLADTVAGIAACTGGRGCVTLNCSMNYLRAAQDTPVVFCRAEQVRAGGTIGIYTVTLKNASGTELATGTYTFYLKERLQEAVSAES